MIKEIMKGMYIKYDNDIIKYDKNIIIVNYYNGEMNYIVNNDYYNYNQVKHIIVQNESRIFFKFDFSKKYLDLSEANSIIHTIKRIGGMIKKNRISIGIAEKDKVIIASIIRGESDYELNIITAIGVLLCGNYKEKCEFVYDELCDYLDEKVIKRNICGFENDKCMAKRNTNCTTGCCHHFKDKRLGVLYQRKIYTCKYLINKECKAKCLTCKIHMCDYVIKKTGVKFTTKNLLPLKHYFNPIQKLILKVEYFTPKEKTLKKLIFFD